MLCGIDVMYVRTSIKGYGLVGGPERTLSTSTMANANCNSVIVLLYCLFIQYNKAALHEHVLYSCLPRLLIFTGYLHCTQGLRKECINYNIG